MAGLAVLAAVFAGPATIAHADDNGTLHSSANQARAASGLPALTRSPEMDQVALAWANQMAANNTLDHNPAYSSQIPAGWNSAAENIAQGYNGGGATHEGWMNSPGHRANILGDFTHIGVAYIAANGTTWAVEVFGRYAGAGPAGVQSAVAAPAPAPAAPAPAPAPAPAAPAPAPAPSPTPTAASAPPTPTPVVRDLDAGAMDAALEATSDTARDNEPDPEALAAREATAAASVQAELVPLGVTAGALSAAIASLLFVGWRWRRG
ncbi:MAG: hypothetical protein RI885_1351 [Actinomycetota bacterium]|jgi:hypothetical protein